MYMPKHFEETNTTVLHALLQAHPLATLVTLSTHNDIVANHIPLYLALHPAPFGTLQGHVSRANPLWKDTDFDREVLAIFQGTEAYITPSWYAAKHETGKVVPTWNYVVVHAHGTLRAIDDPAWLRTQLDALTNHNEAQFATPWHVNDAPADYIEQQLKGIVGIELTITRLIGKWKLNQNHPNANRASLIQGLTDHGSPMAALIPPPHEV